MGGKPASPVSIKNISIQPLPGSYGAPVRRKGHLTIYTDREVLYVKIDPQMTVEDLKEFVKEKTGRTMKVYHKTVELLEPKTLEEFGIDEFAMIKATGETLDTESLINSEISCKSCKSYSINHSKISSPDSSKSLPTLTKLDIDLSIFAAPEVGILKNRSKGKRLLTAIHEADD